MNITTTIQHADLILTECAISERLRRKKDIQFDPLLFLTPLIYDTLGQKYLTEIYQQYREIATQAKLPILLCAPTWRINQERIELSAGSPTMNRDAVEFMRQLQQLWQDDESPLFIGGLLAPKNDCYTPAEALSREEARQFHAWQINELKTSGVDIIVAQTIPSVDEACGMADAIVETDTPYIISFVINRFGNVLDTTPLADAMKIIDNSVHRPPTGYMVNCVYPTFLSAELQHPDFFNRLIGIQANSSSLDHEQLDGCNELQQNPLEEWGNDMLALHKQHGVKILGGCCGTDDTYLRYLADNLHKNLSLKK